MSEVRPSDSVRHDQARPHVSAFCLVVFDSLPFFMLLIVPL